MGATSNPCVRPCLLLEFFREVYTRQDRGRPQLGISLHLWIADWLSLGMRSTRRRVIRNLQALTKRGSIVTAIRDFNRRKRLEKLADQLGTFDDVMSREELLRLRGASRASIAANPS